MNSYKLQFIFVYFKFIENMFIIA